MIRGAERGASVRSEDMSLVQDQGTWRTEIEYLAEFPDTMNVVHLFGETCFFGITFLCLLPR